MLTEIRRFAPASVILFAAACQAQTAALPAFDAASVKPIVAGSRLADNPDFGGRKAGRYTAPHTTLRLAIQKAYRVLPYQILGPAWLDTERYDIIATMPADTKDDQFRLMLQSLLAERFRLTLHREPKEMPVYALAVAKEGPKLKLSNDQSDDPGGRSFVFGPPTNAKGMSMESLALIMMMSAGRPVLDMTDLSGFYDFKLEWTPSGDPSQRMAIPPSSLSQIGLRMESRRAVVEYLVIDHAEKVPTEN